MTKWGRLVIALSAMSLAGCSGGGGERQASRATDRGTPETAAARTSSTVAKARKAQAYTFGNSVPAPSLRNRGSDYAEILQSLLDYGAWLASQHPDPNLAAIITANGSPIRRGYLHDLKMLRDSKLRAYEFHSAPNEITIISSRPDAFSARVVERIVVQRFVDVAGRITRARKFDSPTTYLDLVVRDGDRWLLASVAEQQ